MVIVTAHCSAFGGDSATPCCTTARWLKLHHSLQFATLRLTELQLLIFQPGSRIVYFFRFRFGLGSTAVSNFDSVSVKVQIN